MLECLCVSTSSLKDNLYTSVSVWGTTYGDTSMCLNPYVRGTQSTMIFNSSCVQPSATPRSLYLKVSRTGNGTIKIKCVWMRNVNGHALHRVMFDHCFVHFQKHFAQFKWNALYKIRRKINISKKSKLFCFRGVYK